ncbi:CopG family transcriptional regulator [Bacillus thuringiensis serovar andalousiensis]|uniref:CopG family transcriptional regulator n=1 Tax=Bacillus thuringiensis serovar andalousiensis TaxID=257985 RepID=A0A6H0TGI9_BACTU|nr:CopG family transcriptional regulator [Bacillus thuringiensis]QIW18316.1 CopG family transcriptional regulator [Bacillus thuringiensis serovar andalousiensis]
MKIEGIIASLKESNAKEVGKEIGMCDKRLLKGLKNAGYKHSKKGGIGWYFTGQGGAPLKADIREFITCTDDAQAENADDTLTKKEVSELRKMQQKEKISAQKNTNSIHSLQERIRESASKEKVSRTVYLDKETCTKLGTFEDVHRLNRDDIIEAALREFFERHKM